jgi:hypothetical protein
MVQEVIQLLREYLAGNLSSEEFVIQYLALARILRDETLAALDKSPKVNQQLERVSMKHHKGKISALEYAEKWKYLTSQLEEVRVKPLSKEDEVLSHLFVEADAYREDPEEREEGLHIGDAELRAEVQKALEMLDTCS